MPSTVLDTVRVLCQVQFLLLSGVYSLVDKEVMHILSLFELSLNDGEATDERI